MMIWYGIIWFIWYHINMLYMIDHPQLAGQPGTAGDGQRPQKKSLEGSSIAEGWWNWENSKKKQLESQESSIVLEVRMIFAEKCCHSAT